MKKLATRASEVISSRYSTSMVMPATGPARYWMKQKLNSNSHKAVPASMPATGQQDYGELKNNFTSKMYIFHEAGKYMRAFGADTTKLNV